MSKTTNIEKIREVSTALLYVPIDTTELSPAFVQHPYFNSGIIMIDNSMVNILEDESNLRKARKKIVSIINNTDTPKGLMLLLGTPYYLTWLRYTKQYLSEADFASLLGDAWCEEENPNGDVNVPVKITKRWFEKADKKHLMDAGEYRIYSNLPERLIVYRGVSPGRVEAGLSWTRNIEKATWFSNRFGEGYVLKAEISKKDVLAYFNRRAEEEVVVFPEKYEHI